MLDLGATSKFADNIASLKTKEELQEESKPELDSIKTTPNVTKDIVTPALDRSTQFRPPSPILHPSENSRIIDPEVQETIERINMQLSLPPAKHKKKKGGKKGRNAVASAESDEQSKKVTPARYDE